MNPFSPLHSLRRTVGEIRRMRREIRTIRFLNALPSDLRKDIGWPDACHFDGAPVARR